MPWRNRLDRATLDEGELAEARADAQAVSAVVQALDGARTLAEAVVQEINETRPSSAACSPSRPS